MWLLDKPNLTYECIYPLPHFFARGFQFDWQRGDQQANWTGLFNDSNSSTEPNISDFRSRYRPQ